MCEAPSLDAPTVSGLLRNGFLEGNALLICAYMCYAFLGKQSQLVIHTHSCLTLYSELSEACPRTHCPDSGTEYM